VQSGAALVEPGTHIPAATAAIIGSQLGVQAMAAILVVAYTIGITYAILEVVDATAGLRVGPLDEDQGLGVVLHEEAGYRF
jgi:Amt family ammonium transporter